MSNIIDKLKSNALDIEQLKSMVGSQKASQCEWIIYDELKKFKSIEQLMSKGAVVILLQIETAHAPSVGHFVVLLNHKNHYEHFDSYGLTIDEELKITQEHHLTNLFKTSTKPIRDNTKRLQRFRGDINTCGRWVVARLLLNELELESFLKLIEYFKVDYDDLVSIMTMLLTFKK